MANEKISELANGAPAQPTDAIPIARGGQNYSLAASAIAALGGGLGLLIGGNTSGTVSAISSGTLNLAGGAGITLSQNGQSITISGNTGGGAGFSAGVSTGGNTAGYTGITGSQLALAGGSNISLSQSTGANGATITINGQPGFNLSLGGNTSGVLSLVSTGTLNLYGGNNVTLSQNANSITISANTAAAANISVSAGTSSGAFGGLTFSNSNNLSFGISNGIVTGTVSQSVQSLGLYASSQTIGQSSSTTVDARSLTLVGAGGVSIGMSNGSVVVSGGAGTGGASTGGVYLAGNTTGQSSSSTYNQSQFNISAAGLISAGWSSNSLIISAPATTGISQSLYALGNTTQGSSGTVSLGSLSFSGAGNVSVGVTGGVVVISATGGGAGGGVAIAASNSTFTSGTVVMSVSAGAMTISNGAQSVLFSVPGTSSLSASGAISIYTNGSTISIAAPQTSLLSGAGGMSVSTNGSTISIYENPLTRMIWPMGNLTGVSAPGQGSISVQYVPVDWPVTATRVDALVSWSGASAATANTMGIAISAYAAIFTRNAGTLSSLSSGSTQTTYTYASNSAGNTQLLNAAIRPMSVPMNVSMTPGEYFVAFNFSTNSTSVGASTTNYGQTLSMMGGNQIQTSGNYAEFTAATASSSNLYGGMGVYTVSSAGIPVSMALSNIAQTGASLSQANIAIVLRNA